MRGLPSGRSPRPDRERSVANDGHAWHGSDRSRTAWCPSDGGTGQGSGGCSHLSPLGAPASKERVAGVTGVIEIDPESGKWRLICDRRGVPRISPDGQTVVFSRTGPEVHGFVALDRLAPGRSGFREARGLTRCAGLVAGRETTHRQRGKDADQSGFETWRMDADGKNRSRLPLAATDRVADWSSRGQLLVMRKKEGKFYVTVVGLDGAEPHPLNLGGASPRFSPDGKQFVYTSRSPRGGTELTISDVDGGNRRQIDVGKDVMAQACWSPDGRWLAVSLIDGQRNKEGRLTLSADPVLMKPRIVIVDLDGKQRDPLPLPPGYVSLGDHDSRRQGLSATSVGQDGERAGCPCRWEEIVHPGQLRRYRLEAGPQGIGADASQAEIGEDRDALVVRPGDQRLQPLRPEIHIEANGHTGLLDGVP